MYGSWKVNKPKIENIATVMNLRTLTLYDFDREKQKSVKIDNAVLQQFKQKKTLLNSQACQNVKLNQPIKSRISIITPKRGVHFIC